MRAPVFIAVAVVAAGAFAAAPAGDLPAWHPLREARRAEQRDEPATTMREHVYKALSRVHELLGEGDLAEAFAGLGRLSERNLNPYERAQAQQTYGFIHAQQGRDDEALAAFERCLELDALPTFAQQSVVYSVATYYAGRERYADSNNAAMRWFRHEAEPGADAYMLVGMNHVRLGEPLEGLPYVRRANAAAPPREAWMRMELAILVETERTGDAIALAERMVGLWPDAARHYETLSGLLLAAGEDPRALAVLTVAWLRGLLTAERQLLALARLNMRLDTPAQGAAILEAALRAEQVRPTFAHLELLLGGWTAARETARARAVVERLAELAEDGEYHLRKALLLNEDGDWEGVAAAAGRALEKGGLERPGEAWMLRGVALAELARYRQALAAFQSAAREGDDAARRNAAAWIAYVRDLGRRQGHAESIPVR